MLGLASIGCWDNSTRGLDAATALDFVQALRTSADIIGTTHVVAIYQASDAIFNLFDKVIVLNEGREIYFGSTKAAKLYFQHMGWTCANRQTVPEFLTNITDPRNRRAKPGYENRVPRSAEDFEKHWHNSVEFKVLQEDLKNFDLEVLNTAAKHNFKAARRAAQSRFIWPQSPYMVNGPLQLKICLGRAWYRLRHDMTPVVTALVGQTVMALIVGSVFYGTPNSTDGLFAMGSAIFFAVLLSALIALTEVNSLYSQRPIVVKQASYA
jgi:ATP-binding cassette, subfamily G (WHITE), member 2, PDR